MKKLSLAALALALCLVSCSMNSTTVVPDEAKVRFLFINDLSRLNVSMLKVTFDDGDSARTVFGSQFHTDSTFAQYHTDWYATPLTGTLSLAYVLTDTSGDTVSQGNASVPLKAD